MSAALGPVVVTGAASGIGAALAARLTAAGRAVIAVDIRPVPERTGEGAGVQRSLVCDLADRDSIDACLGQIDAPLSGLANVAGLPGSHPADKVLAVNFLGLKHLTLGLHYRLGPGGSVVLVSSIAAHRCPWGEAALESVVHADWGHALTLGLKDKPDGRTAYELSKRLVHHWLPEATALFHAQGVRVNCVSPGPTETPILPDFKTSMGEDRIQVAADTVGRHAAPDEIAAVIQFLLSDQAGWINGIDLPADGGLHTLRAAAVRRTAYTAAGGSAAVGTAGR